VLEEIDDFGLESYDLNAAPAVGAPVASSSAAQAPTSIPTSSSSSQFPASGSPSTSFTQQRLPGPSVEGSSIPVAVNTQEASGAVAPKSDPRTEKLKWLFNGIKQYCETAEFKRAVNLLGKTADIVETQAKSIWSYFGWGGQAQQPQQHPSSSPPSSSSPSSPASSSTSPVPTPPPDNELTLTLLVVRTNWWGRDQYRFLRFEQSSFVRLRTDTLEECERTPYESLIAAQVTGSTIKFRYIQGETNAEIAYNFGDPEVARMIAEALKFLKGKGSITVSYIGN